MTRLLEMKQQNKDLQARVWSLVGGVLQPINTWKLITPEQLRKMFEHV